MRRMAPGPIVITACAAVFVLLGPLAAEALEIAGICVTPHLVSPEMRWRRPGPEGLAARVELLIGPGNASPAHVRRDSPWRYDGRTADDLVADGAWAWHDSPASWREEEIEIPDGAILAVEFNGMSSDWGVGTRHALDTGAGGDPLPFSLDTPRAWLSAVTFLAGEGDTIPDGAIDAGRVIVHLRNDGPEALTVESCSIWLPIGGKGRVFRRERQGSGRDLRSFGGLASVAPGSAGGFEYACGPLARSHCLVEVATRTPSGIATTLWGRLKIRPEHFEIGRAHV